jgi:hypothetical protein
MEEDLNNTMRVLNLLKMAKTISLTTTHPTSLPIY